MTETIPDHGERKGDGVNPHRGDCTGSLCPVCGCCMHCKHDWICACNDNDCMCNPKNR